MDSSSTAGDSVFEELQSDATAAFLNTATPRVQSTETHSQPVHHEGVTEEVQTHNISEHDLGLDSPNAKNVGAQMKAEENDRSPTNDIKDDASISSLQLRLQRDDQPYNFRSEHPPELTWQYKQDGAKYARTAAVYIEGLENRVMTVEKELLELQYEVGSKERPDSDEDR